MFEWFKWASYGPVTGPGQIHGRADTAVYNICKGIMDANKNVQQIEMYLK